MLLPAFQALASPIITQTDSYLRYQLGFNDVGEARRINYLLNEATVGRVAPGLAAAGVPVEPTVQQAILLYNQAPWALADQNPAIANQIRDTLAAICAKSGVNPASQQWAKLIDMSCVAAPLNDVMRAYHREANLDAALRNVNDDELKYQFQRAQLRRAQDRAVITAPWYNWSRADVRDLVWRGWLRPSEAGQLLKAGGLGQADDRYYDFVLRDRYPDPLTLLDWSKRDLWNEDFAGRYQLDSGFAGSPVATFFARAQGMGLVQNALPGQPDGLADWARLNYRASRPIPPYQLARQFQFRLRPKGTGDGMSVVPGVPAWTQADTAEVLRREGWTPPVIEKMVAITPEPINIRIINTVLIETLKHPELAQAAARMFGIGNDWIKAAFLDHGFTDATAALAAGAIAARADDEFHAERIRIQEEIKKQTRSDVLEQYSLGLADEATAAAALEDEQVTAAMAQQLVDLEGVKTRISITKTMLAEIRAAYIDGKLSLDQLQAQFNVLEIKPWRVAMYVQEWTWQRSDRVRMLATGEIIAALKQGLLTPDVALARLVNLGWTAPDAMVELALAEHEIAAGQARAADVAAAKAQAQAAKAQAAAAKEGAAAAKAAKAAQAAKDKTSKQAAMAPLIQAEAANIYAAKALLDLDAYNTAIGKGETDKANAEIDKAAAAYVALLKTQLALEQQGEDSAHAVQAIEPVAVPPAPSDTGTGAKPAGAALKPGPAPAANGGTGNPPVP
jgi:hypothetical protein